MTKAELIERYGVEWYEDFKAKQREKIRERYHADVDSSRKYCREKYKKYRSRHKQYSDSRRIIYNINARDRNKLVSMGLVDEGMEIHHLKYHIDGNDENWMKDIVIMPRAEHRKWHREHPEFNALEHVV